MCLQPGPELRRVHAGDLLDAGQGGGQDLQIFQTLQPGHDSLDPLRGFSVLWAGVVAQTVAMLDDDRAHTGILKQRQGGCFLDLFHDHVTAGAVNKRKREYFLPQQLPVSLHVLYPRLDQVVEIS